VKALESFRVLWRYRDSLRLHFGHRWLTHFWCANGFSRLCHAFFKWGFILGRGAYQWFSFPRKCPCYFGHFVFMCSMSTFLFHMNNTSFFFLLLCFGKFWQESYVSIWRHYGSRIVGVFLKPFNKMLSLIIDIFRWYMLNIYGGLCSIYFYKELGFNGFAFVL